MSKTAKAIILILIGVIAALAILEAFSQGLFEGVLELLAILAILGFSTLYGQDTYINPSNGHQEHIDGWSYLLVLVFGVFYFAVKRAWRYCFGIILNVFLIAALFFGAPDATDLAIWISWTCWAFFVQVMMKNHYGRIGWKREHRDSGESP